MFGFMLGMIAGDYRCERAYRERQARYWFDEMEKVRIESQMNQENK